MGINFLTLNVRTEPAENSRYRASEYYSEYQKERKKYSAESMSPV
jgi:hypothetical protein